MGCYIGVPCSSSLFATASGLLQPAAAMLGCRARLAGVASSGDGSNAPRPPFLGSPGVASSRTLAMLWGPPTLAPWGCCVFGRQQSSDAWFLDLRGRCVFGRQRSLWILGRSWSVAHLGWCSRPSRCARFIGCTRARGELLGHGSVCANAPQIPLNPDITASRMGLWALEAEAATKGAGSRRNLPQPSFGWRAPWNAKSSGLGGSLEVKARWG